MHNLKGVSTKLLDYKISNISILKNITGGEHEYVVVELASSDGDRRSILFQQPTESCCCSEPLTPKPKPKSMHNENLAHIFRDCVQPQPPWVLGRFTKLLVDTKSINQSSERAADKHPSSKKRVRRWLTDIKVSLSSVLSSALCEMSHSRRQGKPRGAGAEAAAERVVFCADALTRDEWVTRILDELKSNDGRAQAMDSLLGRYRIGRTDVFKKTNTLQYEYLVVRIITEDEGQEYTLRFGRRDRGTGADDPSPDNRPDRRIPAKLPNLPNNRSTDDPSQSNGKDDSPCNGSGDANLRSRGIMIIPQMFSSLWDSSTRITSVCRTDTVGRVWSDPKHQIRDIIVRSIRYTREDSPSLLDLVATFDTVSNWRPRYSIAKFRHCYWLADSLSAVLEHLSPHRVVTAADLQGQCRRVQVHVQNDIEVHKMVESMKNRRENFKVSYLNVRLHAA
jgi:hypothetical protein